MFLTLFPTTLIFPASLLLLSLSFVLMFSSLTQQGKGISTKELEQKAPRVLEGRKRCSDLHDKTYTFEFLFVLWTHKDI